MFRPHALRIGSLVLILAALALGAPAAQAAAAKTVVIQLGGGAGVPTGDFKDENKFDAQTGYHVTGGIDYMLSEKLAIGVDGSFNKNKHGAEGDTLDLGGGDFYRLDKDRFTTFQFGAHAKWMFPMQSAPIAPYALVGVGAYNIKEAWTETLTIGGVPSTSSGDYKLGTRFGGKLGLGAVYKATEQLGIGLEANYNFISEDEVKAGSSSLQYLAFHGGVSFSIAPK